MQFINFHKIPSLLFIFFATIVSLFFATNVVVADGLKEIDINTKQVFQNDVDMGMLETFMNEIGIYTQIDGGGTDGITNTFVRIAFEIKNFIIIIGIIFLLITVIKLLFSNGDEESIKKWKTSIVWVSVGVFLMQIGFSFWHTLFLNENTNVDSIGAALSWKFWNNIISPVVSLLQFIASFAFLIMMFWAFFLVVTGSQEEEKYKKGVNLILYASMGFVLVKVPKLLVGNIYGGVPECSLAGVGVICREDEADLRGVVAIFAEIFTWINTFLMIVTTLLIIYAGVIVLFSGGDEDKLKQAKRVILYIVIGMVLLAISQLIYKFLAVDSRTAMVSSFV